MRRLRTHCPYRQARKTSYTDKELAAYFSDVVYECGYEGSSLKMALLFEHKSHIPDFEYLLVDLSKMPDKEIKNLFVNSPAVKLWLFIQKYIYTPKTLIENLDSFFGSDEDLIMKITGLSREEILKLRQE